MNRRYKHLDCEERGVIFAEHRRGMSLRQIGRLLGRHASTIGRELVRGAVPTGYNPQAARQARDVARWCVTTRQFMRDNWLSNRTFDSYDEILDHCCEAWNKLVGQPDRIASIGCRKWAKEF